MSISVFFNNSKKYVVGFILALLSVVFFSGLTASAQGITNDASIPAAQNMLTQALTEQDESVPNPINVSDNYHKLMMQLI